MTSHRIKLLLGSPFCSTFLRLTTPLTTRSLAWPRLTSGCSEK
jgi:hypothetical protein